MSEKISGLVPPERLNLALSAAAMSVELGMLFIVSRARHPMAIGAGALVFTAAMMMQYSLMHEAAHGVLHRNRRLNDGLGFLLSSMFPLPFTFFRGCHLGHHRRNRSDDEAFELVFPGGSLLKKRLRFYFVYGGGLWLSMVLGLVPTALGPAGVRAFVSKVSSDGAAFVNGIRKEAWRRIQLEAFGVFLVQALVLWTFGAHALILYAVFGVIWSSQQFVTHAGSVRDVVNGAFNLQTFGWVEKLLLNFNWHLAHHQHPGAPWIYLPRFNDPRVVRPRWTSRFARLCHGPFRVRPNERGPW